MIDYTTKATVEINVNGQKAKAELEQQRKLVKELEIDYAKAEASGDKSAKTIHKELNKARRGGEIHAVGNNERCRRPASFDKATPKDQKNTLRQQ